MLKERKRELIENKGSVTVGRTDRLNDRQSELQKMQNIVRGFPADSYEITAELSDL